jgi:hypothetical protein
VDCEGKKQSAKIGSKHFRKKNNSIFRKADYLRANAVEQKNKELKKC